MLNKLKIGDFIIIAAVLIIGFLPVLRNGNGQTQSFSIIMDGNESTTIPANIDTIVTVNGRLGPIVIEIKNGSAYVKSSSCSGKICVKTGAITKPGQAIACVPNRLLIIAEGKRKQDKIDAILE